MSYGLNPTSYFSEPVPELDPTLFEGRSLRSWVRTGINALLHDYLNKAYRHSELWSQPWLAGSGVSYQWSAGREPRDLDCLVGVNFTQFRKANPEFTGLTDREIADEINEGFRKLQESTENWNGYELTFYVNPNATDIRSIKPYAAYDLKYNEWTVTPDPSQKAPVNPEWDKIIQSDYALAHQSSTRFNAAMQAVEQAHPGPARRNAEAKLAAAGMQAEALYGEIHGNRSEAFSSTGKGYGDFHNYRWQGAKSSGAVDLLRSMRNYIKANKQATEAHLYGVDLPDTSTLIRRAATYRNK